MARVSVAPLIGPGMVARRLLMRASDVVFVKGILEASEGLAQLFAEEGGDVTLAAPACREAELDALVDDLVAEVGALRR
jgi:hypothetical protein